MKAGVSSYFKQSLCLWLGVAMSIHAPLINATVNATGIATGFATEVSKLDSISEAELDDLVSNYNYAKRSFEAGGVKGIVRELGFLKIENSSEIKKIFSQIAMLPEVKRQNRSLIIFDDSGEIEVSFEKIKDGKVIIEGFNLDANGEEGFVDVFKKLHAGSKNRSAFWRSLKLKIIPEAQAGKSKKSLIIVATLLLGILKATSYAKKRRAEKARQLAVENNTPLGDDTLYGRVRAPSYVSRDESESHAPLDRVKSLLGMTTATKDSKENIKTPSGWVSPGGDTATELDAFKKNIDNNPKCTNAEYNRLVFDSILEVEQEAVAQGKSGYNQGGGGFTSPTKLLGHSLSKGSHAKSMCSAASYSATIKAHEKYLRAKGHQQISSSAGTHFQTTSRPDDYGIWGVWNNEFGGAADTAHYINTLSEKKYGAATNDPSDFCPGDAIRFDRSNKGGHSVIFLGYRKNSTTGTQQMCYWSSQGFTGGYGVNCEDTTRYNKFYGLKVHNPEVVLNIKGDYNKNDHRVNGTNVYKIPYNKNSGWASRLTKDFHAKINSQTETPTLAGHQ